MMPAQWTDEAIKAERLAHTIRNRAMTINVVTINGYPQSAQLFKELRDAVDELEAMLMPPAPAAPPGASTTIEIQWHLSTNCSAEVDRAKLEAWMAHQCIEYHELNGDYLRKFFDAYPEEAAEAIRYMAADPGKTWSEVQIVTP